MQPTHKNSRRKTRGTSGADPTIPTVLQAFIDEIDKHPVDIKKIIQPSYDPYIRATPKYGRNEMCHCGSGKKYKRCCLNKEI